MTDVSSVIGVRFGEYAEDCEDNDKGADNHPGDHPKGFFAQSIMEIEHSVSGAEALAHRVATGNYPEIHDEPKTEIDDNAVFFLDIDKEHTWTYVAIDLSGVDAEFLAGDPIARIPYIVNGTERSFFTEIKSAPNYLILKVATSYLGQVCEEFADGRDGHVIGGLPLFFNFVFPEWQTTSILIEHADKLRLQGHGGFHPPVRSARLSIL